jgi:hypothetical protein
METATEASCGDDSQIRFAAASGDLLCIGGGFGNVRRGNGKDEKKGKGNRRKLLKNSFLMERLRLQFNSSCYCFPSNKSRGHLVNFKR